MRRSHPLVLGALTIVALSGGGCAASNPGLVLDGVLVPGTMCDYNTSSGFLVEGILDTADVDPLIRPSGIRYYAVIRASNHLR